MRIEELKDFKYYLINRYKTTKDKEYKTLNRYIDKMIKNKMKGQNNE